MKIFSIPTCENKFISQGATGAKILQKHELNNGMQAWARKEQFEKAQKVHSSLSFIRTLRVVLWQI